MQSVSYKRKKLYQGLIGMPILTAGLVYGAMMFGGMLLTIFAAAFIVGCPILVYVQWKALQGDGFALQYDSKGVHIASLYKSTYAPWSDVRRIHCETLQQSSGFGLIKQDLAHYLVFTIGDQNGGLDELKVQTDLLDIPRGSDEILLGDLSRYWNCAMPGVEVAAPLPKAGLFATGRKDKPRDPLEGAPRSDGFDPDAVMARYMAGRNQSETPDQADTGGARPAYQPPHFAEPQSLKPSRPTFGRKLA